MKTLINTKPTNTTNVLQKKRKKPKNFHKQKKDEENILSKDIDIEEEMKYFLDRKNILKPREDLKSHFTIKNLKFRPQKYKGNYLPYHLRWIFNNNVKSNEIVLLNEIEALENEISRLKKMKIVNRECRKISGLPFGVSTIFCNCCHLVEKKKHNCSHKFCNENCPKKKTDEMMKNLVKESLLLKEKEKKIKENEINENNHFSHNNNNNNNDDWGNKKIIFGKVDRKKEIKSLFVVKSDDVENFDENKNNFNNNVVNNNVINNNNNNDINNNDNNNNNIFKKYQFLNIINNNNFNLQNTNNNKNIEKNVINNNNIENNNNIIKNSNNTIIENSNNINENINNKNIDNDDKKNINKNNKNNN